MRNGHAAFLFVLGAFISGSMACTHVNETPPPPPTSMVFKRDLNKGKACLQYSWGSEGKPRAIELDRNIKEGEGNGPAARDASHVEVSALTNGQYSLKDWQFPAGPPHSSPVIGAVVELQQIEAVGTVFYQDGTYATSIKALVPMPVQCPTHAEEVSRVDPEITDLDPRRVTRNTTVVITLIGAHFTKDSVVLIDGADPTTKFLSPSIIEAELDADDVATPGKRGVKVHDAKNSTTSNQVTLTVE